MTFNAEIFVFNTILNTSSGGLYQSQLIKVDVSGGDGWTTINLPNAGGFAIQYALQPIAFNQNAVIAQVGVPSTFASVDLETGSVHWTVSQALPRNPHGNMGEFLFPLGHHLVFVPNFQGYVVYNVAQGEVADVVLTHPISGTTAVEDAEGNPIIFVINPATGALEAFQRNPDY
jgi:hypothetical protein